MTATTDRAEVPGTVITPPAPGPARARPEIDPEPSSTFERVLVGVFVAVPFLALVAAIPVAWGWGLGWHDIVIAVAFYLVSGLGISMGLHRYFTHGSFKAVRGFKIALAVAGSLAIEGPVITWVADHRRHHKYSDKEGDPHSPWRFGNDVRGAGQGPRLRPRRLAVRRQRHLEGEVLPGLAGRLRRVAESPGGSPRWSPPRCSRRP